MDKGWIKLSRQIKEHWIWENPEKLKAWLDLLLMANHETKKVDMREGLVTVRRGQLVTSITKLAQKWGWSRERVRRFLNTLERDGMVTRKSTPFKTTLTIVNYGKYQGDRHSNETGNESTDKSTNESANESRTRKNKNEKENKEGAAPTPKVGAAPEEEEERVEVIPGYTQKELDESFIDGFIPMTEEEWEALGEDT